METVPPITPPATPPAGVPTTPVTPANFPETLKPAFPKTLLLSLLGLIFLSGIALATYKLGQKQAQPIPIPPASVPQLTPTPTPDETANWKTLVLEKLSFKIPNTWWSGKQQVDPKDKRKWIMINPTSLEGDPEPFPTFTLHFVPNTTIEEQIKYMIKTYPLINVKEKIMKISEKVGAKIDAKVSLGPLENAEIEVGLFSDGINVYYLIDIGGLEEHNIYFNQILSTFRFLD